MCKNEMRKEITKLKKTKKKMKNVLVDKHCCYKILERKKILINQILCKVYVGLDVSKIIISKID